MKKAYFISDVHLGSHSGQIEQKKIANLSAFLDAIANDAEMLFIVGDLFDFWFEYSQAIPKVNLKILFKLRQLVESGVQIIYFAGNHDSWLGDYLGEEIGLKITHSPVKKDQNSLKLYIAHGDGLVKQDRKQRILNRIFKNKTNIFLYRLIHPDLGIPLARFFSKRSHKKRNHLFETEYREWAVQKLEDGYDAVILGHTHTPIFERFGEKFYVNLGDWIDDFTYLELVGRKMELKTWPED